MRCSGAARQDRAEGLTWALCRQLIETPGDSPIDARNRALLAVAYDTLLRRGRLTALGVSDLLPDAPGGTVLRVRADTARPRVVGSLPGVRQPGPGRLRPRSVRRRNFGNWGVLHPHGMRVRRGVRFRIPIALRMLTEPEQAQRENI